MVEGYVCCVLQCPLSEPSRSMRSVCFFSFPHPSDPRYPAWIERTLRPKDWIPSTTSKICSRHFRSSDILAVPSAEDCEKTEKRLKHDALPCILYSVQPPVESVPRPDSPEIGFSSVLPLHRPIECVSRPDSPEIGVGSTKKRSAESRSPNLEAPLPKAARVDYEMAAAVAPLSDCPNQAENVGKVALLVDVAAGNVDTLQICCVPGCSVTSRNASKTGDTLFPFLLPEHKLYEAWVQRIRCSTSWHPLPPSFICSQHFGHADLLGYRAESGKAPFIIRLKADALPCRLACASAFHYSGLRGGEVKNAVNVAGMQTCLLCGAKRKGWTKPSEMLMFYPFPTDTHLKAKWTKFFSDLGRHEPVTEQSLLCQNHFAPEDFETDATLKASAVPSRMMPFGVPSKRKQTEKQEKQPLMESRPVCCVPGCHVPPAELGSGRIRYFPFPVAKTRRDEWIRSMRCAVSWAPRAGHDLVCSRHFGAQDFSVRKPRLTQPSLRPNATPSRLECVEKFRTPINPHLPHKGVQYCCVCGWWRSPEPCKRSEKLTFFPFPKPTALHSLWLTVCRKLNPDFVLSDRLMVCENHFNPEELMVVVPRRGGKSVITLKATAVPSRKSFDLYRIDNNVSTVLVEQSVNDNAADECSAPDAGLPLESSDEYMEIAKTAGTIQEHMDAGINENVPLESCSEPVSTARISSFLSNPDIASHNGLPGDEDSVATALVTSALPEVAALPRTRAGNAVRTALAIPEPDDALLYCESCFKVMQTPCWIHSESIPDEPVIPLAVGSLPKVLYMDVCDESPTGKTVFVKEMLERHTVFGPLIAPSVWSDEEKARYVDVSDLGEDVKRKQYQLDSDYACNWMKHVRLADSVEASNLLVFARGCEIVFVSNRTISPHEELRVWYSRQYLDLITPAIIHNMGSEGVATGTDAMGGMLDGAIKEESLPDHWDEEMLDDASLQEHIGTLTPTPDPDCDFVTPGASGGDLKGCGDIYEDLFGIPSDEEIVNEPALPNGISSSSKNTTTLSMKVRPHKNWPPPPRKGHGRARKKWPPVSKRDHVRMPASTGQVLYNLYTCHECGLRFSNKAVLEIHKLSYQPATAADTQPSVHECPGCDARFDYLRDLIQHVDLHGELTRRCPLCDQRCTVLKDHIRRYHAKFYAAEKKKENGTEATQSMRQAFTDSVTCSECGLQFASTLLCAVHKMKHNSDAIPYYEGDPSCAFPNLCILRKCPPCGKTFAEFEQLVKHVAEHGKLTQKCPACQQWFVSLEEHFSRDHPGLSLRDYDDQPRNQAAVTSDAAFHCRQCEKRFRISDHLKIHKIKIHNKEALTCDQCGRRFSLAVLCRLHKMQHGDSKSLDYFRNSRACVQCGEKFAELEELMVHIEVHGVATEKCPMCGKRFAPRDVEAHIRQVHGIRRNRSSQTLAQTVVPVRETTLPRRPSTADICAGDQETNNFHCSACNKKFPSPTGLQAHEQTHQPRTPVYDSLTCDECGLRFRSYMVSRLHRLKHTPDPNDAAMGNDVTCPKCGDTFDNCAGLLDHVEEHGRPTEKCRVCCQWFDNLAEHLRRGQCGSSLQLECFSSDNGDTALLGSSSRVNSNGSRHCRCQDCGQEFEHPSALSEHQSKHLNLTFINSFTCDECGMRFTTEALHGLHVLKHRNADSSGSRKRREQGTQRCPHCNKPFDKLQKLVDHVDKHGRTTDKCSPCNRWFGHLPGHMRRHHTGLLSVVSDSVNAQKQSDQSNGEISNKCLCGICGAVFVTGTCWRCMPENTPATSE
ncbi:uncharacterized protein LOC129585452 isoform X2 [Paramacrobiotus metropolitanus]|uniref:uncharacterized protein LOC129585452 isoform X2 n=1 Tax=Paramacrobiotus metropolitanus TaxID=2943436 RepID=UPI00244639C7|nr:uncharacterized protein LOC129585452 isoform X2 [Paramacrobiotus metropolitanus]